MTDHQYKTYTASEIKNNLTNIFIDAEKEPVIITRRGSKPFVLMQLDQWDTNIDTQKTNSQADVEHSQSNTEGQDPMDEYWNKYMSQTEDDQETEGINQKPEQEETDDQKQDESVNQEESEEPKPKPNSKGLAYYLFEKKYH